MSMRCPRCGATFGDDVRYCANDGDRLVAAVVPAPAPTPRARPATPRDAAIAAMTGQILAGRYRVERKVGEGGMSFVYLAVDTTDGSHVAVKALSPALSADAKAMARLRREATLGKGLKHPNVCHILEFGETPQGFVYLVMPFLEGTLLSERRATLGTLPLPRTVTIVREIAAGLQVAHALGIIHRDLKPENVMMTAGPDGAERAVVMDFGLAKQHQAGSELEKLTATGIVLGTPEFMSPEQLRGKPLDARTDIYSLALMAVEMLTGFLPFTGRTKQDMMIARLKSEPTPLTQMRPELHFPLGVERALNKGMARDRADRYRTAPEFAAALSEGATGDAAADEPARGPGSASEKPAGSWLDRLLGR